MSFNLILPELNEFLENMGKEDFKWAVLAPWTFAAAIARPLSGKMADVLGRKFVMITGVFISMIMAIFYPILEGITLFIFIRFFHGFSTGFQPTGATALAADLIPEKIRGEAMGIFSISISLGFGLGQFLGSPIKLLFNETVLFYSVILFGLISLYLILPIKETYPKKKEFKIKDIIPKVNEIFSPEVYVPSTIMFLISVCTGFYFLIIPDMSKFLGLENKGLFFATHMISSLIVRYVAGRISDRIGRRKSMVYGILIFAISTFIMMYASNIYVFIFSAFLYGVGTGIISPTLFAWTTDLSNPKYKGRGLSTMFMGLEFGILFGSFISLWIYQNKQENIYLVFLTAFIILSLIFIYLITWGKKAPIKFIENE